MKAFMIALVILCLSSCTIKRYSGPNDTNSVSYITFKQQTNAVLGSSAFFDYIPGVIKKCSEAKFHSRIGTLDQGNPFVKSTNMENIPIKSGESFDFDVTIMPAGVLQQKICRKIVGFTPEKNLSYLVIVDYDKGSCTVSITEKESSISVPTDTYFSCN